MALTRALLTVGAAGAVAFVVTCLVDGTTRPGYRPLYHPVSALALGSRGWIQRANFLGCGALITSSALGVLRADASRWLATTIAVFGLALMASGAFRMDPMRGYPPGSSTTTPTATSRSHDLHDAAGITVFAALPLAAAIAAFTVEPAGWAVYSGITAVAATVAFIAFGDAWERDHPLTGLVQRVTILIGWTWLAAICLHLAG